MTERLGAVRQFADNVLKYGRIRWGASQGFVFRDAMCLDRTKKGGTVPRGKKCHSSDFATHQNLLRVLDGLTNLCGEAKYGEAAKEIIAHHFDSDFSSPCGLLRWGKHNRLNLQTKKFKGGHHELKCHYPFYELMWEVNSEATKRFIEAFWNAHVLKWSMLDMNRHGCYGKRREKLWDNEFVGAQPFFEGEGLTFINCGSDLVYAAGMLYAFTGDEGPLKWAKLLAEQYVKARDPKTGLGAYQYSQRQADVGNLPPCDTHERGGDRAKRQLGDRALEGKVLDPGRAETIYGGAAISQMRLVERIGPAGECFLEWARAGLLAYAEHAYERQTNMVCAKLTDGTSLSPEDIKRPGYYKPETFEKREASPLLFLSYTLAHRLTKDPQLWQTVRNMARGHALGELGDTPGAAARPNLGTDASDPTLLMGLLEVMKTSDDPQYRNLSCRLAENILSTRFHDGFFLQHRHGATLCSINAIEPLALLSLEAWLSGKPEAVPLYPGREGRVI